MTECEKDELIRNNKLLVERLLFLQENHQNLQVKGFRSLDNLV